MTSLTTQNIDTEKLAALNTAIAGACKTIAPNWPLDRMIAVNPYWGMVDNPFQTVHRRLASLGGSSLFMPLDYYRERWEQGEISEADLQGAIDEQGETLTPSSLVALLERHFPPLSPEISNWYGRLLLIEDDK